jgi:hypothetical protein
MLKLFKTSLLLVALCLSSGNLGAAVHRVPQDHASIQAAIDAAQAGDTVLVAPGTYRERIQLKAEITVRSAGEDEQGEVGLKRAEATIIDGGGENGAAAGVAMAENATLDGFTVTNVGRYDEAEWNRHHATHGNEQSHEHIGQPGTAGIGVVGVNCTVTNNIVHHIGYTGIAILGKEGTRCQPRIAHNVCYRNMGGGIGSMRESTAIIESNRCFQNFYAGIGHDDASPIVMDNECYENIRAGIGVSEGSCPVVRGNRCYHNRRAGIGIRTGAATSPVVEDNECYENDMAGIGCDEEATPIIRGNRCHHNALAGIGTQSGARPVIVANKCFENRQAGIGCREGAAPVIVGNECLENQTTGIGVRSGAHAVICSNRCIDNRLVAMGLPDGASAVIYDNELSRSGGMPPLLAIREGSSAIVSGNRLQGGGVAGILVQGTAHIADCDFQGAGPKQGSAIWIWDGSTVDVSGNEFNGYGTALNAAGSRVSASDNHVRAFRGTAIVVRKPAAAAHVRDNAAYSDDPQARAVDVEGDESIVSGNVVRPAAEGATHTHAE